MLGVGKSSPHCPLAPVERCLDRADPLSPIADSRFRVQAGWLSYIPCWFRRSAAEVKVSADIGSFVGCGESLSHLSPITSRTLLAMVGMSGLGELCLPLHPEFSHVPL